MSNKYLKLLWLAERNLTALWLEVTLYIQTLRQISNAKWKEQISPGMPIKYSLLVDAIIIITFLVSIFIIIKGCFPPFSWNFAHCHSCFWCFGHPITAPTNTLRLLNYLWLLSDSSKYICATWRHRLSKGHSYLLPPTQRSYITNVAFVEVVKRLSFNNPFLGKFMPIVHCFSHISPSAPY